MEEGGDTANETESDCRIQSSKYSPYLSTRCLPVCKISSWFGVFRRTTDACIRISPWTQSYHPSEEQNNACTAFGCGNLFLGLDDVDQKENRFYDKHWNPIAKKHSEMVCYVDVVAALLRLSETRDTAICGLFDIETVWIWKLSCRGSTDLSCRSYIVLV